MPTGVYERKPFTAEHKANMSAAKMGNTHMRVPIGSTCYSKGYRLVKVADPDVWQLEHRVLMAQHLGRSLLPTEVVHHRNEVKDDNRLENLRLFENTAAHTAYHNEAA
jgi:hypothetical protein